MQNVILALAFQMLCWLFCSVENEELDNGDESEFCDVAAMCGTWLPWNSRQLRVWLILQSVTWGQGQLFVLHF